MNQTAAQSARAELGKFFSLIADGVPTERLLMPSGAVDAAWHALLSTEEYPSFCRSTAGVFVEHYAGGGHEKLPWVEAYERKFGALPDIWFADANGNVDEDRRRNYAASGEVWASWDCGPIIPEKVTWINNDIANLNKILEINRKIGNLKDLPGPGLGNLEKIDDSVILDRINDRLDKFDIEKIKQRHGVN